LRKSEAWEYGTDGRKGKSATLNAARYKEGRVTSRLVGKMSVWHSLEAIITVSMLPWQYNESETEHVKWVLCLV